ncbi:catalase [Cohnella hashimotonis]|uniref:Catalase-related peroxidase n=1 Tax=Cohnella hashimotonis TaxID=2826895 RepID=A0ABT6TP08_9BACL|nr:catalase [Cohnella hashimotonis]MDI4648588.1 catalase [Cohnella hashimotonis]
MHKPLADRSETDSAVGEAVRSELINPTVDALEGLSGVHPGNRRVHAKGICCRAEFTPSGLAAALTTAAHLRDKDRKSGAIVRFSGSSSDPSLADLLSPGKGLAVQFQPAEGDVSVLTAVTVPVFFARTPASFLDLIKEANRLKGGGLKAIAAAAELAAHFPEARHAMAHIGKLKPPASYGTCRYYAIHAFLLVDGEGNRRPVKFEWLPELGVETLSVTALKSQPEDYLELDAAERIKAGPLRFRLNIVLGREEDPTDDPTLPWPDDRQRIEAGVLDVTEVIAEPEGLVMDPMVTGAGIEPADDPILRFRSPVYRESLRRRSRGQ